MTTALTGEATDRPNRYEPFRATRNHRIDRRTDRSERDVPGVVPPLIFQAARQKDLPS